MTSHDHPMSGGFGVWFLQYLGGIGLGRYADAAPLRIAPVVPRQLRFVNSRRKCRTGEIVSNWYKTGDEIHFDFRIPWNLPVSIALPKLGCTRADLTINGKPAVDDPMLEETAAAFCREVGMGIRAGSDTLRASELGGTYVIVLVVENIPSHYQEVSFEIRPYLLYGETRVYGRAQTVTYTASMLS